MKTPRRSAAEILASPHDACGWENLCDEYLMIPIGIEDDEEGQGLDNPDRPSRKPVVEVV